MCGINGIIFNQQDFEINLKIGKMNDLIIHRGPDDDGTFLKDNKIAMGMRRLSIIDLSTGDQPIYSEDRQKVIVFNGEIYNYKLLKEELENKGILFKTSSDTEVILKLYEKYGTEAFGMLDGMFAFSIYDSDLNKVFIARDFFGEKPIYYASFPNSFYWASELKSIVRVLPNKLDISMHALNLYFQLTYIPAPFTIYEEVHKLEPNHYLVFDQLNFSFQQHEIQQSFKNYKEDGDFSVAKDMVHNLVQESVLSRTISDVPVGSFLSGGVDSSIISLCMAEQSSTPINTFSIGFEKKEFDESEKARTVAKLIRSNHHEYIIGENDLLSNLDEIILNFDEPYADSSALASYIVAQKAGLKVKVVLTGDGADEIFGGYNKYYIGKLNKSYTKIISRSLHEILKRGLLPFLSSRDDSREFKFKATKLLNSINYEEDFYYSIISLGYTEEECKKIFNQKFFSTNVFSFYKSKLKNKSQTITDFKNIDRLISLEGDMLAKVDRTGMLCSLECRAPFLSKELWNYSNSLPESYLIKGWDKKHILKEAFKHYFPDKFFNNRKQGFGVPVGDWLRSILRDELVSYIEIVFLRTQNIFNENNIIPMVENHLNGKIDNTFKVWTFFCFQKWYRNTYEKYN